VRRGQEVLVTPIIVNTIPKKMSTAPKKFTGKFKNPKISLDAGDNWSKYKIKYSLV